MATVVPVLELLLFTLVTHASYLASTLASARLLGARAEVARLGMGPKLFATTVSGVRLELAALPLVAWVVLEGMRETDGPPVGFRAMHPLRRMAVVAGSWVLPALLAVLAIGPARAGHHFATALPHLWRAFDTEAGVSLARAFLALSWSAAAGVFLAKMVAFNLLAPLPGLSSALLLRYLLTWIAPATDRDKVWSGLHLFALPVLLGMSIKWIYVLYRALAG